MPATTITRRSCLTTLAIAFAALFAFAPALSHAQIFRPAYHGKPEIVGLTSIQPVIICSRIPSGQAPFHVMLSASETTANVGNPYTDLDYRWTTADGQEQQGPEAAFMLRAVGAHPVTLKVTGRNEAGKIVTATTSIVRTIGTYYLFRANATGGTFTLTFNGETTTPIPYNANVKDALHALPSLDATNFSIEFNGNIEFGGKLTGQDYVFSADFSGLTGCNGKPELRVELQSRSSDSVTVTDTWSAMYFDSNYDGSNGTSNGTFERPFKLWGNIASWLTRDNRVINRIAYLKCGSAFTMTDSLNYNRGNLGVRLLAYGDGAKPVIKPAGSWVRWQWEQCWGDAIDASRVGGDFVFSGITFERPFTGPMFTSYASDNDNKAFPYSSFSDIVWDRCEYSQQVAGGDGGFVTAQTNQNRGTGLSGLHFNDCNLDMGMATKQAIFAGQNKWLSFVGGSIRGGNGSVVMDHHIYSDVKGHQLFRDIVFGAGVKNFSLNINANNAAGAVKYCLIDGCDIGGTENGIDLSNSNNDRTQPGLLDQVVIQFCRITPSATSVQKLGLYGQNHKHVTLRYSELTGNTGGAVRLYDGRVQLSMYGNVITGGTVEVAAPYYSSGNTINGVTPPVHPPVVPVDRSKLIRAAVLKVELARMELTALKATVEELTKAME